jgi:hypothetical protein
MPLEILKSPEEQRRNELIEEMLSLVLGTCSFESPIGQAVRQELESIGSECRISIKEAEASLGIVEGRKKLARMADAYDVLAEAAQENDNKFMHGAATFSWTDTPEQDAKKRQEIKEIQESLRPPLTAEDYARKAKIAREQIARWPPARTGELNIYEITFGAPKKQLAKRARELWHRFHPTDLNASRKGNFYQFLELLFEFATDKEPDGDKLLRHAQEAMKAIRHKP